MVIRGNIKLNTTPGLGTGDPVLTRDTTDGEVGYIGSIDTSVFIPTALTSGYVIVGNGSNIATPVVMSGDTTISNAGVVAIGTGVIVNADVNASAAITLTKLAATTASRALVSDASGFITTASVTSTELGYVSGVTSAIQTQLNAKQATITGGATSIVSANLTASRAVVSDGSGKVTVSASTSTEVGYLSGVTSAIQTQINTKQPSIQFKDDGVNEGTSGSVVSVDFAGAGVDVSYSAGVLTVTVAGAANGLPTGGTIGQVLIKNSGTDYDASFNDLTLAEVSDVTASVAQVNVLATGYYDASSSVQTQLNSKLSTALSQNYMLRGNGSNIATAFATGSPGTVLTSVAGVPTWAAAAGLSDGDRGDITVSASGTVWTIDNTAVTLAKMADVATATVFYRKTAGTGVPEVQTLATLKTDLGLTGTNSGDQTSIVGITGTLAQFNSAMTDGDFADGGGTATGVNTGDQNIANTNDATSHTVTVGSGTVQFIEGSNITLTTGGTGLAGTVTIASTGGGLSDGDYGDITVGGGGTTLTVDTNISKTWTGTHIFTTTQVIDSLEDAGTTTVLYPSKIRRTSSGTPAAGLGVGLQFEAENGSSSNKITGTIDSVYTDVTNTQEGADMVFYKIGFGSLVEALRLTYGGLTTSTKAIAQGLAVGGSTTPGTYTPLTGLAAVLTDLKVDNASNTSVSTLRLSHHTAAPATGIGVRMEFATQTGAANAEIGATIEAITTDVTAASEDFDLVFNTMAGGAAADEKFRIKSTGDLVVPQGTLGKVLRATATVAGGATLRAIGSAPQTIIAAPGANKVLHIHNIYVTYNYGSAVYNFASTESPVFVVGAGNFTGFINYTTMNSGADFHAKAVTADYFATIQIVYTANTALTLTTQDGGDATTGDGDLDVVVYYTIEDVNT